MTVHKALAELKILDSRINKSIDEAAFVQANKHANEKISGVSVEAYVAQMRSAYDSVVALIARREAMKRAVVKSNAVTEVAIGDRTYTVAEAIEMKNHGVILKNNLLCKMRADLSYAKRVCDNNNGDVLEARANDYVQNLFGSSDMKNGLSEEAAKKRAEYIKMQTYELIDPLDIHSKIDALCAWIDAFMTEVDAALSVSNALTEIEFEY